jgi:hypothetical protein
MLKQLNLVESFPFATTWTIILMHIFELNELEYSILNYIRAGVYVIIGVFQSMWEFFMSAI